MTKPNLHSIVVKTLLTADEFLAFSRQCVRDDIGHSPAIRNLISSSLNQRTHRSNGTRKREWPDAGQNMAMFPGRPGRAGGSRVARLNL